MIIECNIIVEINTFTTGLQKKCKLFINQVIDR